MPSEVDPRLGPKGMKLKKREAQDRVLALLSQGSTITDAMKSVNRLYNQYYVWCKLEPWFKARANAIRTKGPEEISDFVKFRQIYFGFDTPDHQQQIIDLIEEASPGSITMILIPPGAGKTTVLEDWFNYKLGKDPNYRIVVVSETATLARKILGNVQNRMVDRAICPLYIDNYGPFRADNRETSRPWNAGFFQHVQSNSGERDYSMEARGAGSSIYGASCDLIVLDDIQSSETLNKTEALLTYFRQTLYSRVMRANSTGKIIIIGTRQGQGDFYEELLKDDDVVDALIKIPALDEHGHSYFPKRKATSGQMIGYSEKELERVRAVVQENAWSRQYMQEPISRHGQTFTESMIRKVLDYERGISDAGDPLVPGTYRIAALDPALAGHSVFRVAGFDYDKLHLLDGRNVEGLARFEDMYDIIEQFSIKWHPQKWIIETNNLQNAIGRSEQVQAMAAKYGFQIESHQTGKNKQDELLGVASMAGTFLRGELSIPYGDPEARESFDPLIDELKAWRADVPTRFLRQDEVMCLWFLHLSWQRTKTQLANRIDRHIYTKGLPWKSAAYRPLVGAR